ncbi:hypothetical protein RSAG8_11349, partial [Rhizoctonia solani AG-8 WAC10335]
MPFFQLFWLSILLPADERDLSRIYEVANWWIQQQRLALPRNDGVGDSDTPRRLVRTPAHHLSKEQQAELEADLCKLFVANGWAWHGINGPETQIFFEKWFPATTLPDRHKLSGPILQRELEAANASMRNAISGRVATGMSDGWKNIRRNSLIASMLSVDYTTYTVKVHDVSAEHKTAENHLNIVLNDIDYAEKEHNIKVIAWVSDAGGDSRAMRVRLHRLRPYILVFDCWAHQINLVVGNISSQSSRLVETADSSTSIIKWMLHHSYLLGLLHQEQVQNGGKSRSLTLPVLTRWTSHFLSFRSLLTEARWIRSLAARNPEAFRASAGRSPERKEEVERILKNIEDPNFWNQLTELKLYLEPLAIAANVSQAATTRLDHILIELGRLYNVFSRLAFNPKMRDTALESLERRWGKADQDPFILAVFLNPFIRGRLFSRDNTLLNRSGIYGVVKRVFRRIFRKENDLELYKAFLDYYEFRNEFSPDRWDYREQQAVHDEAGQPLNLVDVWSGLLMHQTPNSGRHQLAYLATHILSIVANSAGCERLFSEMGHIHTKRRSRLGYQKVFDSAVVRMSLKRKHAAEGRTRSRLKRQFGSSKLDSTISTIPANHGQSDDLGEAIADTDGTDEGSIAPTMRSLATQLHEDVLDDEDPPEPDREGEEPIQAAASASEVSAPKIRLFFGTQIPVPLRDPFEYTPSTGTEWHGLDIFKSNGLANLQMELELYGLATQEMQKDLETDNPTD